MTSQKSFPISVQYDLGNSQGSLSKDSWYNFGCWTFLMRLKLDLRFLCHRLNCHSSVAILLTVEKHFNMENVKEFIYSNKTKWFCVCKLWFKNVKTLKKKYIDYFRYTKIYADSFMMQYVIYTCITNAFVSMLCWKNELQ